MLLYSYWMRLSLPSRHALASKLGIPKKGPTHVVSNHIQSDGYDIKDVEEALSVEKLQSVLSSSEADPEKLLDKLVGVIEGRDQESISVPVETVPPVIAVETTKPKRGRPKKNG